jgi:UDP-4-amino-4,6-dideoxy-N-acetyl-beta-L-altrosamine N-acetyltransferase
MPDRPITVTLEPLSDRHLEATLEWLRDPRLRAQIDSLGEPSPEGHRAYWERRLADENHEAYAVLAGSRHVGNGGLQLDRRRLKAELWLYLGAARRQGIGRRAATLILRRAFRELGLNRVAIRVVATNEGALPFWRSLGFTDEGRAREDTWIDGCPVDSMLLGLLARDWAA